MGSGGGGIRLRPLDIGDVLDETFRVYRRQFVAFMTVMGFVVVPSSLLSLLIVLATGFTGPAMTRAIQERGDFTSIAVAFVLFAILGIVASVAHLVAAGAAARVASNTILGHPVSVGDAYREAFGHLGSLLLGSFVTGLAVGLLFMTCLGLPFAVFIGLGWSLLVPSIVLEGRGAFEAMSRSWDLVNGHRWRLLAVVVLIGLIVYLLVSVPAAIFGFISGGLAAIGGGSPGLMMAAQAGNVLFQAVGQTLFGAVFIVTITLLYYDLRIRKEAFDLEQRLPQPQAGPVDWASGASGPPSVPPPPPGNPSSW
jgi:hypothetical protein